VTRRVATGAPTGSASCRWWRLATPIVVIGAMFGAAACGGTHAPALHGSGTGSGLLVPPVASDPTAPIHTRSALLDDTAAAPAVAPVRLRIPALRLDAPVGATGVGAGGELDVPPDPAALSWYRFGASPGEPGSALIAGHVDFDGREGVFFELRSLGAGADVEIVYADGSSRSFTVTGTAKVAKADLAAADVFSPTGPARLVLITCGGSFDPRAHAYRDNVVVTATPR
jgi:hypothetical protein